MAEGFGQTTESAGGGGGGDSYVDEEGQLYTPGGGIGNAPLGASRGSGFSIRNSRFAAIEAHNVAQVRAAMERGDSLSPTIENSERLGLVTVETNPILEAAVSGSFLSTPGGAAVGNPFLAGTTRVADPNGFANQKTMDLARLERQGREALARGDGVAFQSAAIDYALRSTLQSGSATEAGFALLGVGAGPLAGRALGAVNTAGRAYLPGFAVADDAVVALSSHITGSLGGVLGARAAGETASSGPTLSQVRALREMGVSQEGRRAFFTGETVQFQYPTAGGADVYGFLQLQDGRLTSQLFSINNTTGGAPAAFRKFVTDSQSIARSFRLAEVELQGGSVINTDLAKALALRGFQSKTVPVPNALGGGTQEVLYKLIPVKPR